MSRSLLSTCARAAQRGVKQAVRLLAPDYCAACDAPVTPPHIFCEECGSCPEAPLDVAGGALAAGGYAPPLSTAIVRMKFGQRADIAARLAELWRPDILAPPEGARIVPVPLHYARLVARGFNPAALLARRAAAKTGCALAIGALQRQRDTAHQSQLPAHARRDNVAGAFFVAGRALEGRHVVLIDDVITTGSTTRACADALYAAGVVHVTVLVLAATPAQ